MKLSHLKYGFLISATTLFGAGRMHLYAQDNAGKPQKIENKAFYKKRFMQSIAPQRPKIAVEFMVDSIRNATSNGNLLPDINVIQLYADLDNEEDEEYLDSVQNQLAAAHEMWHRICLMNGALERPMSATHFRTGQDNFEITACIVALLTFRDIYLTATPEQQGKLHHVSDPKVQMYLLAVDHDIIKPFSKDKNDFDFEMKFIAQTVSSFWNNTMSSSYADYHNTLTINSGRKELDAPVYEENFKHDIKMMNTIGGIDFSKYYDFTDIHNRKEFPKGQEIDTNVLSRSLDEPDYETWINEKSQLKRFSRQKIELTNFVAPCLINERNSRPLDEQKPTYKIISQATGYKAYPKMKMVFFTATELQKGTDTFKFYPCGALDKISKADNNGYANVMTFYFDGSFEKGTLFKGRKNGIFVYYNNQKQEIGRCVFSNGKALEGTMVFPFNNILNFYPYHDGKLQDIKTKKLYGKPVSYLFQDSKPLAGLLAQTAAFHDAFMPIYKQHLVAQAMQENHEKTDKLIKFRPVYRNVNASDKTHVKNMAIRQTMPIKGKQPLLASIPNTQSAQNTPVLPGDHIKVEKLIKFRPVYRPMADKPLDKETMLAHITSAENNSNKPILPIISDNKPAMIKKEISQRIIDNPGIPNERPTKIKKVCRRVTDNAKKIIKKKTLMLSGFILQKR